MSSKKNTHLIAITGPESTGKSTMAQALAAHYKVPHVSEFARSYLATLSRTYQAADVVYIAKQQLILEQQCRQQYPNAPFIFCDTDVLVTKIWYEHKYQQPNTWINEQFAKKHYSFHLLMNVDIAWQADPQREHPHLRQFLFNWYKKELQTTNLPFTLISGRGQTRLQNAVSTINTFFSTK